MCFFVHLRNLCESPPPRRTGAEGGGASAVRGVIAGLPSRVLAGPWGCGLAGLLELGTGLWLRATGSVGLPEVGPRHGQTG